MSESRFTVSPSPSTSAVNQMRSNTIILAQPAPRLHASARSILNM